MVHRVIPWDVTFPGSRPTVTLFVISLHVHPPTCTKSRCRERMQTFLLLLNHEWLSFCHPSCRRDPEETEFLGARPGDNVSQCEARGYCPRSVNCN
jgi:hypothetical protein